MKTKETLPKALQNAKPSKWLEEAKWRSENRNWLSLSFQIASRVYAKIKEDGKTQAWLALQLGCTAQYVGRILKGRENLTLHTITKLENILEIKLIECPIVSTHAAYQTPNIENLPNVMTGFMKEDIHLSLAKESKV